MPKRKLRILKKDLEVSRRRARAASESQAVDRAYRRIHEEPLQEAINENLDRIHAAVERIKFRGGMTPQEEKLLEEIKSLYNQMKSIAVNPSLREVKRNDALVLLNFELDKKLGQLEAELEKSEKRRK